MKYIINIQSELLDLKIIAYKSILDEEYYA